MPSYFMAIEGAEVVPMPDVRSDPRARELLEPYLIDNDVHAMLDATLWDGNRVGGVLCSENVGRPRRWSPTPSIRAARWADSCTQAARSTIRKGSSARHVSFLSRGP